MLQNAGGAGVRIGQFLFTNPLGWIIIAGTLIFMGIVGLGLFLFAQNIMFALALLLLVFVVAVMGFPPKVKIIAIVCLLIAAYVLFAWPELVGLGGGGQIGVNLMGAVF